MLLASLLILTRYRLQTVWVQRSEWSTRQARSCRKKVFSSECVLRTGTRKRFTYGTKYSSLRAGTPTKPLGRYGHLSFWEHMLTNPCPYPNLKDQGLGKKMKHCPVQGEAEDWVRGFFLVKRIHCFTHLFLLSLLPYLPHESWAQIGPSRFFSI